MTDNIVRAKSAGKEPETPQPKIIENKNGIFAKGITFVDEHGYIEKCKAILEVVGNLRLKGETGTGKTTLVHRLAEVLNMALFEVGLTRNVTSWDLLGCDTLRAGNTELREGIILQWLKNKDGGILYLDGFNYADPSMICLLESLADFRGCAEEHSLVVTQRGIIEIRKVKKSDKVLTHDKHGTRFIRVERIFKFSNVKEEFIKIITEDGKQLIVSKDHKIILNNFREVEAKDLNIGDTVNIVDTYEENNQRFVQKSESDKSTTFANSIRIFSWLDRRRRFNNDNFTKSDTQKSWISTIVKYLYNKYFYQSNDMAKNFRIQNTETKSPKSKMERLLYGMSRRIWNVAIAQTSRTTFNNQTKAMPISNSIHRNTVKYGTQLAIYGTRYSDSETSETTQHTSSQISYKASLSKIVKIEKFYGTLNYVDLTTENHKYFANGILIHNSVWIPEIGKTFVRSEKHYLVISYNPSEKAGYSGTFLENIATIRRFEGLVIDYLSTIQERTLIKSHSGNYDFAVKFVEIGRKTRTAYKEGKLRTPLTSGNLINYAKLFKHGLAEDDIIEIASSLFPEEEVALFRSFFEGSDEIDVEKLKSKVDKDKT